MCSLLERLGAFLARTWKWFALGLAAILALLLIKRKTTVVVQPVPNPERDAAEKETQRKIVEAAEEKALEAADAKQDHKEAVTTLLDTQEARTEEIKEDGNAVNSFLMEVGKKVRE